MTTNKRIDGFTIVELMIATVVFGVVLMGVTGAILQMTKNYQKSMYVANTQAAANTIIQSVSQSVKYNGSDYYQGGPGVYCIGNRAFHYAMGRRLVSNTAATPTSTPHALVTQQRNTCTSLNMSDATTPLSSESKELLGHGMRLAKFSIASTGSSAVAITVRVVYGEDDLLCRDDVANSCQKGGTELNQTQLTTPGDLRCRPDAGSEYCAVSELTTLVQPGL